MCKAINAAGEAVTTCQVTVEGKQESPSVLRSVRTTVDSIEGRSGASVQGSAAVGEWLGVGMVNGVEGASSSQSIGSERVARDVNGDVTDAVTEKQHTTSTLTNAYTSSSTNQKQQNQQSQQHQRINATTDVYHPFYSAECTYVERTKMPVPEEKSVEPSETKTMSKSSISKTSTIKSSSDFFTSTWDNDQPFPVPVAFNMRDLSLDQFKTMNEFFSGSSISNPDYFDKKDTKHHESESKSWKEGNTEYHRSTTKTEMTSFTTSKKTIVTEMSSGTPAPDQSTPSVHDTRSSAQTRESKSSSQKTEKFMPEFWKHQPRSIVRTEDADAFKRRSQSLQQSSCRASAVRSHSVDGGRIIPVEIVKGSTENVTHALNKVRNVPERVLDNQTTESMDSKFMKVVRGQEERQAQSVWKPVESKVPTVTTKVKDKKSQSYNTKTYEEHLPTIELRTSRKPIMESSVPSTKTESTHTFLKNDCTTIQTDKTESEIAEHDAKAQPVPKPFKKLRSRSVEHVPPTEDAPVVREPRRPRSARRSEPYVMPAMKGPTLTSAKLLRRASPSPIRAGPKPFTPAVYSDTVDERVSKTSKTSEWTAKEILKPVVFQQPLSKPTDVPLLSDEQEKLASKSHTIATMVDKDMSTLPAVSTSYTEVIGAPAPCQTDKQRRMEETFVKKVIEHQEHEASYLPELLPVPKPTPIEMAEQQKFSTLETRESKIFSMKAEQHETPKASALVPRTPAWHEPVQTLKATQTEQQKRMEEKFIKKVTESKESKEHPITSTPEVIQIYDTSHPPRSQSPQIQKTSMVEEVRTSAFKMDTGPKGVDVSANVPESFHKPEVKEVPKSAPPEATNEQQFYTRKICESKTVTMNTQEEIQASPSELSSAIWHEPKQTPKTLQTEQQKRMEEKFIRKTIQRQDFKEISSAPREVTDASDLPPVPKPQPVPLEVAEEQKVSAYETREFKALTTVTPQQETLPAPPPVLITPVWHERVQTPKAAQTEQQKRMEEKFIKKVTERKESKEFPITAAPAPAPISAVCEAAPVSTPVSEAATMTGQQSVTEIRKFQTMTTQSEVLAKPVPEPIAAVWHEPTQTPKTAPTEQQIRKETFIKNISEHKESTEVTNLPEPLPVPINEVLRPVDRSVYKPLEYTTPKPFQPVPAENQRLSSQAEHETISVTLEQQKKPVAPVPVLIKPIWHEPMQTPKPTQTEQQKRMEEKFMKQVTEHKETEELPAHVPAPIDEVPRPDGPPLPQPEETSLTHESRTSHVQKITTSLLTEKSGEPIEAEVPAEKRTQENRYMERERKEVETPQDMSFPISKPQEKPAEETDHHTFFTRQVHESKTVTKATQQEEVPPVRLPEPTTPQWHEPVQTSKAQQTEQQKRMEEKFMKKVTETQQSKDIAETHEPALAPALVPVYGSTSPFHHSMPEKHQVPYAHVPIQKSEPISELMERQNFYTQELHESQAMTMTNQKETTTTKAQPGPITPIWHEPEQAPKVPQTEQQKTVEEKYMKMIGNRELKDTIDAPLPVPEPATAVYDTSQSVQQATSQLQKPFGHLPIPKSQPSPESTEQQILYTQGFHESKTMTMTAQQDAMPHVAPPVPITPIWHEPEQAPKAPQTEQQKRMEEKFLKKVVEHHELSAIPESIATAPVPELQVMVPVEETNQQQPYTQEMHESKMASSFTLEKETPAKKLPELITPVWSEPLQAAQTEQQKRMEEKFINKVIQNQESKKAQGKSEPIPVLETQPTVTEHTGEIIYTKEVREFKSTTITTVDQETQFVPAPEPVKPVPT